MFDQFQTEFTIRVDEIHGFVLSGEAVVVLVLGLADRATDLEED